MTKEDDLAQGARWLSITAGMIRRWWRDWRQDHWSADTPNLNAMLMEVSASELPDDAAIEYWHDPESSWGWLDRPVPWRVSPQ